MDNIDFHSDNETLDVRNHRKTLEAVKDIEPHNDKQDKRRYSVDTAKSLRQSSSKTSLRSLASPDSSKSYSLNSLSSSYGADITDYQMVDQEDIINLTVQVRQFSDAINNLRSAFSSNGSDTDSDGRVILNIYWIWSPLVSFLMRFSWLFLSKYSCLNSRFCLWRILIARWLLKHKCKLLLILKNLTTCLIKKGHFFCFYLWEWASINQL